QGVDDFLVASGAGPFHDLVAKALPVPAPDAYALLTRAEGRTDVSNAARLVARHGEALRWVGPWDKWLVWDGTRWAVDQALAIDLKAKDVAAGLFGEIARTLRGHEGHKRW